MKVLKFVKMVASGNDFLVVDRFKHSNLPVSTAKLSDFSRYACDRKFGVGADGVLVLEPFKGADFRMRIFNVDGSEAEMCGNGSRCAALYYTSMIMRSKRCSKRLKIKTMAGLLQAQVNSDIVKVKLTDPKDLKLDVPLKINGKVFNVHFINTGVPHVVFFSDRLSKLDIVPIAREIRFHKKFKPAGTNVNFVTIENNSNIKIRTYERGVEAETLSCGTGSTAAAIIAGVLFNRKGNIKIKVKPVSKEKLLICYNVISKKQVTDVWLEGKADIVYKGEVSKDLIGCN
ncbi:MAG: diaminopimelate epimerase [Candidatus Gygaella obscura]|nr:diaminopimelate epimerase [Candidatus Gygaella obscura]